MSQLNLTNDQRSVLNDVLEANQMITEFNSGSEPEDGDLTWVASAIGRGLRLVKHLDIQSQTLETIEILNQSKNQFLANLDWCDTLLLETNFQESIDEFEALLVNQETTSLELMTFMIELDRLVCALELTSEVDEISRLQQEALIQDIRILTEVHLDGSLKLASKAEKFISNQGVTGQWKTVWENFTTAEEKLERVLAVEKGYYSYCFLEK